MKERMTLDKAVEAILQDKRSPMFVEDIARDNRKKDLWRRKKDNKYPEPWQIVLRMAHKLDKFAVIISLRD